LRYRNELQISQIKYRCLFLFEDISKSIADICNKLQMSVIHCRYLQMWIKMWKRLVIQFGLSAMSTRRFFFLFLRTQSIKELRATVVCTLPIILFFDQFCATMSYFQLDKRRFSHKLVEILAMWRSKASFCRPTIRFNSCIEITTPELRIDAAWISSL